MLGDDLDKLHNDDDLEDSDDAFEMYCVKCKEKVEATDLEPVWTSKGTPGTRGICPECGTTVFRMGSTPAHEALIRPTAVRVEGGVKTAIAGGRKRAQPATYINYAEGDAEFAHRLAADLEKAGIHTWIDTGEPENVKWAGGVHPALKDSVKMVVILSGAAKDSAEMVKSWTFFKGQKKPIVLAVLGGAEIPNSLRRTPRFDFNNDYISTFRQLLSALSD